MTDPHATPDRAAMLRAIADAIWKVTLTPELGGGRLLSDQQAEAALDAMETHISRRHRHDQ